MINAGKSIWATFKLNTAWPSKYKISSTSLFIYRCTSLLAFCSTWCPTNTMLRIAVCCTTSEEKWKIYDKESNIYFNGWNISVGLVTWIDWERTIVFIQSHFTPTGKKTLWVASHLFGKLPPFRPPYPSKFPWFFYLGPPTPWKICIHK